MTGGLLNLVSSGQQNIILNGNPQKTHLLSKPNQDKTLAKTNSQAS